MDPARREITKLARYAEHLVVRTMREGDVGAAEFDLLQTVRKNPGISQSEVCAALGADKGAIARRTANLVRKGYLRREADPADGRARRLYATGDADALKHSRAHIEAEFYEWLLEDLDAGEQAAFVNTLHKLYQRAEAEAEAGYVHVTPRL